MNNDVKQQINIENKPIPKVVFPSIGKFKVEGIEEPLVSLSELGFCVESSYYNQGIEGSYKDVYLRQTAAELLLKANSYLPNGYSLKVYDGYRPICVQQHLWDYYREQVAAKPENQGLTKEEIDFKTSFFVSKPSYDISQPSLHNTGGAIDVTIIDADGKELNMGTEFDDFSNKAWSNHFEEYADNEEIRNNRRLLYWTMLKAGFTNLPSEWWHFDYGTKFWGYFTGNTPLYEGILDARMPDQIINSVCSEANDYYEQCQIHQMSQTKQDNNIEEIQISNTSNENIMQNKELETIEEDMDLA